MHLCDGGSLPNSEKSITGVLCHHVWTVAIQGRDNARTSTCVVT